MMDNNLMNSLTDDIIGQDIFAFVGPNNFRYVATTCKRFHHVYRTQFGDCQTSVEGLVQTVGGASLFLAEADPGRRFHWSNRFDDVYAVPPLEFIHLVAIKYNRLDILQWTIDEQGFRPSVGSCQVAAEYGNLEALQFLRARDFPWDSDTCSWAAKAGQIETLKWLRANGCDWDSDTCAFAAGGGHLETLKWARANGCDWNGLVTHNASERGHTEVLQWAIANGCPVW